MYDICERLRSTPRADIREVMCEAADEIERLRLTDAERELLDTLRRSEYLLPHGVKIIDGLLERMGGEG